MLHVIANLQFDLISKSLSDRMINIINNMSDDIIVLEDSLSLSRY